MTLIFSLLSILIAILVAFLPLLPAFFPVLGLMPLYRMRPIRGILIAVAWVLAIAASVGEPVSFIALPFILIFSIPVILLEPQRVFVSLDDPEHVPASIANIDDNVLVLGYEDDDGYAAAWSYEALVPRHLINDQVGDVPLLVAY